MRSRVLFAAVLVLLALVGPGPADDAKFVSGPQPGQVLPGPFHPFNLTGPKNYLNRFHCLVCEYGNDPVALVFVNGTDFSPAVVKLLHGLNVAIVKQSRARLHSFAVILDPTLADVVKDDDQREALRPKIEQLDKAAELNDGDHLPLALDSAQDLKAYKLSDEAVVTVVLYREQKVVANYAFRKDQLDDKTVATVLNEGIAKLVGGRK